MERAGGTACGGEELPPQGGSEEEHPVATQDCSHQGEAIKPRTTPAHGKAYSCKNYHLTSGSRFCFPTICLFYIYCTVKTEMH